jgi:hypothetical protein
MRFRFIEDRRADYPVRIMCDVLGVSPAGYYAWRSRPESRRSTENLALLDDIKRVHHDNHECYGSPRIHRELKAEGHGTSRGRVERLMRRYGVRAILARPRWFRTTDSQHDLPIAPNLLDRNFTAAAPNRIWPADITYVETGEGWLHLSTVMDLYSRRIVGWAMQRPYAHRTAARSTANGHLSPAARRRPDAPFRPWCSIRIARLSHSPRHQWDHRLDEAQGQLLRQCTDGKLLPHAQNRAGPSPTICNTRRSPTRYLCLHRGLLQQDSAPFSDRLYQPDRDGAKSCLTLSTFLGEDHDAKATETITRAENDLPSLDVE